MKKNADQKTHLFLINPVEYLVYAKDSSLYVASTLKAMGQNVYLIYADHIYLEATPSTQWRWKVFDFSYQFYPKGYYLEHFKLTRECLFTPDENTILHMRLDPPFDEHYLKTLWLLVHLEEKCSIQVINSAKGVLNFNEKVSSLIFREYAAPTYMGADVDSFLAFVEKLDARFTHLIMKPMNGFQGLGVERVERSVGRLKLLEYFIRKKIETQGPIIVQPFLEEVMAGELRSTYFAGEELGTIVKRPQGGQFLANVSQGATYEPATLSAVQRERCQAIVDYLRPHGIEWVAFDLIGESISEVNITCPGLLGEVAYGIQKDAAAIIIERLFSRLL